MFRYTLLVISIILISIVDICFAISPKYYILYCKKTCSKRTQMFKNVDKRLYCYKTIPYRARKYIRTVLRVCEHYALDPTIMAAQIECESGWRYDVVSPDGGYGLTQITPRTANVNLPKELLLDPEVNLIYGAQIKLRSINIARKNSKCSDYKDLDLLAIRIYNGGWRFLNKEMNYLNKLGLDKCKFDNQKLVCARDLCLWKVNIVYVYRILNSAKKYKRWLTELGYVIE